MISAMVMTVAVIVASYIIQIASVAKKLHSGKYKKLSDFVVDMIPFILVFPFILIWNGFIFFLFMIKQTVELSVFLIAYIKESIKKVSNLEKNI